MKENNLSNQSPHLNNHIECRNFIKTIEGFSPIFDLIKEYENSTIKSLQREKTPPIVISPKEFLSVINNFENNGIFKLPKNRKFYRAIKRIYASTPDTIEEKAAYLLYSIIKADSFEIENIKAAIICFIYFLNKNHLLKNKITQVEKEILFFLVLLMQKSNAQDMKKILTLTVKMFIK